MNILTVFQEVAHPIKGFKPRGHNTAKKQDSISEENIFEMQQSYELILILKKQSPMYYIPKSHL